LTVDPSSIPWSLLAPFILIGFAAQLVDGTTGSAFGFVSRTMLVFLGVPPVAATAASHSVESFTSGISGLSHAIKGNVDWPLFARLVVPGIIGGVLGVWLLAVVDLAIMQPALLIYMAALGVYLVWRGPRRPQTFRRMRYVRSCGLAGGFLDASGGGWGPVVSGSLLAQGMTPRMAIGTVNAVEFFVTVTILASLIGSIGAEIFTLISAGLLIGGVLAAPLGAYLAKTIAPRLLVQMAGCVMVGASFYGLLALTFDGLPGLPRV